MSLYLCDQWLSVTGAVVMAASATLITITSLLTVPAIRYASLVETSFCQEIACVVRT